MIMRVWEKNFLVTLSLFVALFFVSVFVVVTTSFSSALSSEREATLREEALLARALQKDIDDIEARENPSPRAVPSLVASYAPAYQRRGIYLQLEQSGAVLFGNLPVDIGAAVEDAARVCVSLEAEGAHYLCVYDALGGAAADYPFTYLKDIDSLYASQNRQAMILIATAVAVSAAFASLLYIALRRLYRPIDNLAHELRTPLTSIRGYAEYLQNAAAGEEERYSAAQYIIGESRRLSEIWDKLLILANVREGEIAFERVDIPALFGRVKMAFPGVEYEAAERYVRGDAALLQSLVMNLVSNAVRLSFCGNVLEVRDTGCGMSADMLSRLNKPNYRKDISGKTGGNGLGVPLCHQIARAHRAQLSFTSVPGEGTTARVTFTVS
jgi:signal transduction histidine kinase